MSFAPHEVYSRCLLGTYGCPLWTPQLKTQLGENYQLEGLKIGDVGLVSPIDGSFDVLFNITLDRSEQPDPALLREGFKPIVLDQKRHVACQLDAVSAHGVISSPSMELTSQEIHDCDIKPSRADYEFALSTEEGAALILPEGAESADLTNEKMFLEEAIRHGIDWYQCATEEAGRLIYNNSLYLITGFHKTHSWSLGVARRNDSGPQKRFVKFKVGPIPQDNITAGAYVWMSTHGFTGRVGPMHPYQISDDIRAERICRGVNQTVFIRGFRITVNKILFLKTVSVKTRQGTYFGFGNYVDQLLWGKASESTSSSGAESATDNEVNQDYGQLYADKHMTIDRVPGVSQTLHPGDFINQYMLKEEPRAMVAITHDSLWIEMLQMGLLELVDFSSEKRLQKVLPQYYRLIMEDGAVYLQTGPPPELASRPSSWTGSVETLVISEPVSEISGQEQAKEQVLAVGARSQILLSSSGSAMRTLSHSPPRQSKVILRRQYRDREAECFNALRNVIKDLTGEELMTRSEILGKAIELLSTTSNVRKQREDHVGTLTAYGASDSSLGSHSSSHQNKVAVSQRQYREREGVYFKILREAIKDLTGEELMTRSEVLGKAIELLLAASSVRKQREDHASTLTAYEAFGSSLQRTKVEQPGHQPHNWPQTWQYSAGFGAESADFGANSYGQASPFRPAT